MSRIEPSWDEIEKFHNPLTDGEKHLARFLDENLSEDWKIYVQPYLNGKRPDIAVFNPQIGLMIYEVKDWKPESFRHYKPSSVIKQVNNYKNLIIEQLVPDMGEKVGEEEEVFWLIKTGIYLHNIKGHDARKRFNFPKRFTVIGYDDLDYNLNKIVPDYNLGKNEYMRKEWVKEIKFWLKPPFHSKEQINPIKLTEKQQNHAKPKPGHHRLRGAAGSGKTLVMACRAAKLAEEGYKVLVITYNITLWHYIRDMIKRAPYKFDWENINYKHFHGFCNEILDGLGVQKPHMDYLNNIVPAVENAISNNNIDKFKYDAILIDEGQDYKWEWYNLLCNFLKQRDELFLVCDKNQNIYKRDLSWLDAMKNVKFRGRWGEINTIYRMPKKIGDVANKFSETFNLDQSVEGEEYKQLTLFEKPPLFEWEHIDHNNWLLSVVDAYQRIKHQQMDLKEGHPSDIAILLPSKEMGIKAVELFSNNYNIEVNHVFEGDNDIKYHRHKKAFWLGDSRLKISTIHSFKGWEANHVIILIPRTWKGDENLDSLVYTAITRTRKDLIILNCNDRYFEFGNSLKRE